MHLTQSLHPVLQALKNGSALVPSAAVNVANRTAQARPGLFQAFAGSRLCIDPEKCSLETTHMLLMVGCLSMAIIVVICTFNFIREDKEELITPLSPQLVVRERELVFKMPAEPLDAAAAAVEFEVWDFEDKVLCKITMDWPDPFKPGAAGVAATVRVQNPLDVTLATVVARSVAVVGQGIALCKTGCEIFGFVDVESENKYQVRHRSGVQLLTLIGDFANCDVEGYNPAGTKVCRLLREPARTGADGEEVGPAVRGRIHQQVDAGLIISSFLATQVHRRLLQGALPFGPSFALAPQLSVSGHFDLEPPPSDERAATSTEGDAGLSGGSAREAPAQPAAIDTAYFAENFRQVGPAAFAAIHSKFREAAKTQADS
mmetsp:Transcript_71635/g.133916  ORF Transcript_71635/g.133916 Transcript_71635/m.133916 type:complete len:374 (+) Transcript_71635:144-1265(+)